MYCSATRIATLLQSTSVPVSNSLEITSEHREQYRSHIIAACNEFLLEILAYRFIGPIPMDTRKTHRSYHRRPP